MMIVRENRKHPAVRLWRSKMILAVFVFITWLAINTSAEMPIVITGLVFSFVLSWIFVRRSSVWHIRVTPRSIFYFLAYIGAFLFEMVKANINMVRYVYSSRIDIRPGIVKIDLRLKSPMGRLALANSIALTPGSLVIDITDDAMYIHWLDVETTDICEATRIIAGPFEQYLGEVFG